MGRNLAAAAVLFGVGLAPGYALGGMGYGGYGGSAGSSSVGASVQFQEYTVGMRIMHAGNYADAIPHLERALTSLPHSAEILTQLGIANTMMGKYRPAYSWLQKALAEDPKYKRAHETLGVLYLFGSDPAQAQGELAVLVRLCPESCDERDKLMKVITVYQAAHPALVAAPDITTTPTAPAAVPSNGK